MDLAVQSSMRTLGNTVLKGGHDEAEPMTLFTSVTPNDQFVRLRIPSYPAKVRGHIK